MPEPVRLIYLAHDSAGRLRCRLSWLREEQLRTDGRADAAHIADALADLDGVEEVQLRPFTGSVLVTYDPARLDAISLKAALCRIAGVDRIIRPGEESPEEVRAILHGSYREGSDLSRIAVKAFQGLNVDFLRMTGGRMSLGAFASLSLWVGAAGKLISTGEMEMPAWHQMLWWGFRLFDELEGAAIHAAEERPLEDLVERAQTMPTPKPERG